MNDFQNVDWLKTTSLNRINYRCPEHGDQGGLVGIELKVSGDALPAFYEGGVTRSYCMQCWIEMMDRFMCQVVQVDVPSPESGGE